MNFIYGCDHTALLNYVSENVCILQFQILFVLFFIIFMYEVNVVLLNNIS